MNKLVLQPFVFLLLICAVFSCSKDNSKGGGETLPKPKADFVANSTQVGIGDTVIFTDRSLGIPSSWSWTFEGADPAFSLSQRPGPIVYNTAGRFRVKLVVSNPYGIDSIIKLEYINVVDPAKIPRVSTAAVNNITISTASVGGNVTSEGTSSVFRRGICWGLNPNPTISDSIIVSGSGLGAFRFTLSDLEDSTTYNIRAFAENSDGVAYGSNLSFTTKTKDPCDDVSTFTDPRDGKEYKEIVLGSQIWMGQNLNFGSATSWCYDENSSNCDVYGRLYTWNEARNVCPEGWHLPTDAEWEQMISFIGTNPGLTLKSRDLWNSPSPAATNPFCFGALPSGYRNSGSGLFITQSFICHFWSNTQADTDFAFSRTITHNFFNVERTNIRKVDGLSVRCIKD